MMLPALLLPILTYLPFSLMGNPWWGIAAVGVLGVVGFMLHKQLLGLVVKRFQQQKYAIAAGFRQS